MTPPTALAVNIGSSTLKCALFTFERTPRLLERESIDITDSADRNPERLLAWLNSRNKGHGLAGVGHRIVHGGSIHSDPQRITDDIIAQLRRLVTFAPNHLPPEIELIDAVRTQFPDVPQVACFDTAFHQHLLAVASRLPIPASYAAAGIRRYGFHGLSYTYLIQGLHRLAAGEAATGKVVLAHLGNGSSLAAVHNGRSIDTTMAFTPIGGVVMSTRAGDLDPGVVIHIARHQRLSPDQMEEMLSRRSGLLGISGISGDMRTLLERERRDEAARLAVESYVYSIRKAIGGFAAALDGLDAIVFSGGIGEHASVIRARICAGLSFLGLELSAAANDANAAVVSHGSSRVIVRVIPTDEELVIARSLYRVLVPE